MLFAPDSTHICEAFAGTAGNSAKSGDWLSLKGYDGVMFIVHQAQGGAAAGAITVDKATDVAGSDEDTGITLNNWWKLEDTPTAASIYTKGTAGASITTSATGTGSSIYLIDINAAELGDGFDCVQCNWDGNGNAGNRLTGIAVLYRGRYQGPAAQHVDPTAD